MKTQLFSLCRILTIIYFCSIGFPHFTYGNESTCEYLFLLPQVRPPKNSTHRVLPKDISSNLVRFAYSVDTSRLELDRNIWLDYKNGPNLYPVKIDLSLDDLRNPWAIPKEVNTKILAPDMPNRYEAAVISLKKGDTVKIGNKEFELGDFIGSGNASHIYRLAKHPHMVIKLPFIIEHLTTRALLGESHYPLIFEINKITYKALAKQRSDITTDRKFRYILMPFIQGKMMATEFLSEIMIIMEGRPLVLGETIFVDLSKVKQKIGTEKTKLLKDLIKIMTRQNKTRQMLDGSIALLTSVARQIMLSEDNKWEVLDAE